MTVLHPTPEPYPPNHYQNYNQVAFPHNLFQPRLATLLKKRNLLSLYLWGSDRTVFQSTCLPGFGETSLAHTYTQQAGSADC